MPQAPRPSNDAERSAALLASGVLTSAGSGVWDRMATLLADQLGVPFAAVTFFSNNKQWFLGTNGFNPQALPRDESLCGYTIYDGQTLIINDVASDQRAAGLPLVLDGHPVKSYIGCSIRSIDGFRIGTVCAVDYTPRVWSGRDKQLLENAATLAESTISVLQSNSDHSTAQSSQSEVSANLLDNISMVSNTGGWALDLSTNELYWTRQTRRIHEVADDFEPNLETAIDFYAPEARPLITAAVEQGIEDGTPWDMELPLITARGNRVWVRALGECEFRHGKPYRLIGSFQDISERRKRNAELTAARYSETQAKRNLSIYLAALEQHSVLVVTNSDGEVSFANEKFCQLSGYSADELIGGTLGKLNSHFHSQEFYLDMRQTIKAGNPWHGEICNRRKDGGLFWLDTTIVPRLGDDGSLSDFVNICFDITDWVNHRNELERQRSEAEDATSAKTRFLASMSHEIRTPLNGVVALAGALANTDLRGDQREMVDLILKSGEGLNVILSDILDISRIEEGMFMVQKSPFNFAKSIETVVGLLQLSVDEKGLDLNVSISSDLNAFFIGDDVRIRQVVSNLLSNAVKFTDCGAISITCEIMGEMDGGLRVRTTVQDTGVGMTSAEVARVFHRFEQGDSSLSRSHRGVGLGLWICHQLCELMGGRIWVESEMGVGSSFVFDLPLVPAQAEAIDTNEQRLQKSEPVPSGLRVLLAEDHVVNQRVFSLILNAAGFELEIVDNGQKAFERWIDDDFAFVLMDLQMPRVDGLAATRMIRQHEERFGLPRTPIAALSANAMDEHKAASIEAGVDLHISKPVTPEELLNGISQLMKMRSAAKASSAKVV